MKCQQQLSVRSSAGVLEAPSGYASVTSRTLRQKTGQIMCYKTGQFYLLLTYAAYRRIAVPVGSVLLQRS